MQNPNPQTSNTNPGMIDVIGNSKLTSEIPFRSAHTRHEKDMSGQVDEQTSTTTSENKGTGMGEGSHVDRVIGGAPQDSEIPFSSTNRSGVEDVIGGNWYVSKFMGYKFLKVMSVYKA